MTAAAAAVTGATRVVGHRGGALLWPENSLAGFRAALALPGLAMVECDVHSAADGVPVVMHDATLDRTTEGGTGPVAARSSAELARVPVRGAGGEGVPTLAALCALVASAPCGAGLQVEVKDDARGRAYPGLVAAVLRDLDAHAGLRARAAIIAFRPETVAEAAASGAGLDHVALLFGAREFRARGAGRAAAEARAVGADTVETRVEALDGADVAALRAGGVRLVGCWGANDEGGVRRALSLRLDMMATDDPPLALRLRADRDGAAGTCAPPR